MQNFAATYYWKSKFVPHPKILGPAGTKLVIFSRYRLGRARRCQLPRTQGNLIERDFNLKRAILEVELPLANGESLTVLNTHLEAFPKGTNVMERQIQKVLERLNWSSRAEPAMDSRGRLQFASTRSIGPVEPGNPGNPP